MLRHFQHDCNQCRFLGHYDGFDLYVCDNEFQVYYHYPTLVCRNGDEGPQYKSFEIDDDIRASICETDPHFKQALEWLENNSQELIPEKSDTYCVECGYPFDDNRGKTICITCEDWLVEIKE
mgnify:CR=1 FL=1